MAKIKASRGTKTRSTPSTKATVNDEATSLIPDTKPPNLLILPAKLSSAARICTSPHPRNSLLSQYLYCPTTGLYEIKDVSNPRNAKQSWLIEPTDDAFSPQSGEVHDITAISTKDSGILQDLSRPGQGKIFQGHVLRSPSLLIATPIDPVFLTLPALLGHITLQDGMAKGCFLSVDDIFEVSCDKWKGFAWLLRQREARATLEERVKTICDSVSAGDEKMYRLSISKLLEMLIAKARAMIKSDLPRSMEDQFVSRSLETPIPRLRKDESTMSMLAGAIDHGLGVADSDSTEAASISMSTSNGTQNSNSSVPTGDTTPSLALTPEDPSNLTQLLRLRTCLFYLLTAYVDPTLAAFLKASLASDESPINFKPLEEELSRIATLRSEASVSRLGSKRDLEDDEEAAEARAEKRRKRDEEEKRKKAGESHGLRALKKVDISGMKKMSDFFTKGIPKKAK